MTLLPSVMGRSYFTSHRTCGGVSSIRTVVLRQSLCCDGGEDLGSHVRAVL
jgi:hypothetical protein